MLGKRSGPVIGIITGSLVSGNKLLDLATSPMTHFQPKPTQSPKGLKNGFDFGGVGLGIVAALECSGADDWSGFPANKTLISRNSSRSIPIPMNSPKRLEVRMESESLEEEEYTIVTRHLPNKPYTTVYGHTGRDENACSFNSRGSVFHVSPARFGDDKGIPGDDFLSSCHLCHKRLQGEDIYMYRGEKAFCSTECRYREIVMDERREKCSSEASRGVVDVSSSPYGNGQIFTTGILAV